MKVDKNKLGIAMANAGCNFTELIGLSGVSRNTLSAINNGRNCSAVVLGKIAKALNIEPKELLKED